MAEKITYVKFDKEYLDGMTHVGKWYTAVGCKIKLDQ